MRKSSPVPRIDGPFTSGFPRESIVSAAHALLSLKLQIQLRSLMDVLGGGSFGAISKMLDAVKADWAKNDHRMYKLAPGVLLDPLTEFVWKVDAGRKISRSLAAEFHGEFRIASITNVISLVNYASPEQPGSGSVFPAEFMIPENALIETSSPSTAGSGMMLVDPFIGEVLTYRRRGQRPTVQLLCIESGYLAPKRPSEEELQALWDSGAVQRRVKQKRNLAC